MRRRIHKEPFVLSLLLILGLMLAACDASSVGDGPATSGGTTPAVVVKSAATDSEDVPMHATPAQDNKSNAGADMAPADNEGLGNEGLIQPVVQAHNRLGVHIHQRLTEAKAAKDNVFISPLSISLALAMAYNGAQGATAAAMADTLHLSDLTLTETNEAHRQLLDGLAAGDDELGVRLRIANALWHRRDFLLARQFVDDAARYYDATTRSVNFADPASLAVINEWVTEQTEGLIKNLVERLDDDLVTLLVNTVYFKGKWTVPFDAGFTRDDAFQTASGPKVVPFMYRDGRFDYRRGDDFEAIRLPYGPTGRMAMYVFLPGPDVELGAFAGRLSGLFDGFTSQFGEVRIPKLDVAYKTKLNDVLTALGMGVAFDPSRAHFGKMTAAGPKPGPSEEGMAAGRFFLGDVIHQTVLKVDEEGTEAAAATSVGVRVTSMPQYEFRFTADRPFILAIRDDDTGGLLFLGTIANPADA